LPLPFFGFLQLAFQLSYAVAFRVVFIVLAIPPTARPAGLFSLVLTKKLTFQPCVASSSLSPRLSLDGLLSLALFTLPLLLVRLPAALLLFPLALLLLKATLLGLSLLSRLLLPPLLFLNPSSLLFGFALYPALVFGFFGL
jgi:hypothetical protein